MITYAEYTNVGERENNEDSIKSVYSEKIGYSFVVADGLGGHGRGEDASKFTVDTFEEEFTMDNKNNKDEAVNEKKDLENKLNNGSTEEIKATVEDEITGSTEGIKATVEDEKLESAENKEDDCEEELTKNEEKMNDISGTESIKDAEEIADVIGEMRSFDKAQYLKESFEKSQKKLEIEQDKTGGVNELKTTAVALTIQENKAMWGHIGDSRLYVFNKNKVVLRTLDHSVPQMLVFAGEIKEKKIRKHPDRNRLLRVLGARNVELKVDYSEEYNIDDCQAFLLCTDGFWECITEKKMCKFLKKSKSVEEWLEMMAKEVRKNGMGHNMDNNSAIAVWVKDNKRSGRLWM